MTDSTSCSSSSTSILQKVFLLHLFEGFPASSSTRTTRPLDRCIRFLNQKERACAARASKFLLIACSSHESWCCDGVYDSLYTSATSCIPDTRDRFHFNAPTLHLTPTTLPNIRGSQVFKHARCIEFRRPPSRNGEFAPSEWNLDAWSDLEHLFLSPNKTEASCCTAMGKLPNTLKSFSLLLEPGFTYSLDFRHFLALLPPTLHTLQIIIMRYAEPIRLDRLTRFDNLEKLTLIGPDISNSKKLLSPFDVSSIGANASASFSSSSSSSPGNSSLSVHCDMNSLSELCFSVQKASDSPTAIFCKALTHIRLYDCGVLQSCPVDMDWAEHFPRLDSLRIELFPSTNAFTGDTSLQPHIPGNLGTRIRSLFINELLNMPDSVERSVDNPFMRAKLTNLTKLTIRHLRLEHFNKIGCALPELAHLSIEQVLLSGLYNRFSDPNDEISIEASILVQFVQMQYFPKLKTLETSVEMWPNGLMDENIIPKVLAPMELDEVLSAPDLNELSSRFKPNPNSFPFSPAFIFPSLTELKVAASISDRYPTTCYPALSTLRQIPSLRSVKWGEEPWLSMQELQTFYSIETIKAREMTKLRLMEQQRTRTRVTATAEHQNQLGPRVQQVEMGDGGHPTSTSTIARHFNMFNLSLAFQALTPVEVARASTVSKHWRNACLSPLILRHHIRVEMHQLQGAKVHGPQIRISDQLAMTRAVGSAVFKNLRILTLSQCSALSRPCETRFAHHYLRLFEHIPLFTSLHTLSLSWSQPSSSIESKRLVTPSVTDLATIRRVIESAALQHLKVFRIMAASDVIHLFLRLLPKLQSLEVVELRHLEHPSGSLDLRGWDFAGSLLQLPLLKRLYVCNYGRAYEEKQLLYLKQFCHGVSAERFEEVLWRVPMIDETLKQINLLHSNDNSFTFPFLKSIHINELQDSLQALSDACRAMPHLCDVSIGKLIESRIPNPAVTIKPLPSHLSSRLRNLKIKIDYRSEEQFFLPVLQSLRDSNITQLECLHIFRSKIIPVSSSPNSEVVESLINDTLYQLLDRSPALTELNCPTFSLGGSDRWLRLLPRLHVVYGNSLVTPFIDQCKQLREFHCNSRPDRNLFMQLLALPHFQMVSFLSLNNTRETNTRAEVAVMKSAWIQQEADVIRTNQQASRLLESTSLNSQQLTEVWKHTSNQPPGRVIPKREGDQGHQMIVAAPDSEEALLANILTSLSTS